MSKASVKLRRSISRHALLLCALLGIIIQSSLTLEAQVIASKARPKTRVDNVKEEIHGVTITDPYRWLEDQNSPETRAWINEQNQYSQAIIGSLPNRDEIRRQIGQLLKIDFIGSPVARSDRYFFIKRLANQNQPVIYLRRGLNGKDEVLVDPNTMSTDQTASVNIASVSQDGKLLAYGLRQGGADEVSITFLDVDSRKELPERLPLARYSGISFKPDKSGFFYSRAITTGQSDYVGSRVYYHRMGASPASDEEIFGAGYGPTDSVSPSVSLDGHYLTLFVSHGSSGDKMDVFVKDLQKNGPIVPVVKDIQAGFTGEIVGDHIYLLTNWQSPNKRVVDVDLQNPAPEHWRVVVPEGDSVMSGLSLAGGKLFVSYLENVKSHIKVFEPSGKQVREIAFPTVGAASGIVGRWDRDEAFYTFNSFAQPPTIYRYQVSTGKQEVWARINVPIDSSRIEVKQVWYESKDRTRIPMFVVYQKGIKLDGNHPTLLTGYGGFNVSRTANFSAQAAFWVAQGGVFALPNLRGGGEFGEKWHRAGMLDQKQNVFDDFIGAAEWLIKNNYTRPSRLAISGGSNGGLLVGAAMTQRPDLFQAVVCSYPLLDMVRYHRFLVAKFWVPEYGSADDAQLFPVIYRYSPYHNVKDGVKYPAVLFITGDSDTRVAPLHARKMTARLQAATSSERPILLHYDTKAGHSGGLPVSKQIEDLTDEMSFLLWQLGVTGK